MRTPLNAIIGLTHLLLIENPKKGQLKYLTSLKFSGDYLLTFINEILEINRIDSGNVVPEKIACNLRMLITDIHNSMSELAVENNNTFTIEIDPEIPEFLLSDPIKLTQIFINLVNNALKFTNNGVVKLVAERSLSADDTVAITFKIIDNGIGIPEEKHIEIFESFSQGSIEINRKYGGTGLGLNIVRNLVTIMGGAIELESEVGVGSTFSFSLSFEKATAAESLQDQSYENEIFVNKKILLIEDNKINQMITVKMLNNKQMLCEIIDNGEDAVVAAKQNRYDLILMDVHLPGINGTIATQMIREFDTTTPIIALTAISLNENRESLLSYGMNDVITKPFDPENFYKIISNYL